MHVISLETNSKRRKITSSNCVHFFVRYGIYCNCRSTVDKQYGRSFDYLVDGLQLSHNAVEATKSLTKQYACKYEEKLHLIIDLEHTVPHTIHVLHLSEDEEYLSKESESREDLWILNGDFLVKLRPFLHEFLKEANELFTMYVYTMGTREYATKVLKLIDPKKVYFGDRVITRYESGLNTKMLDLVLADESGVVIVDDTPQVWSDDHKRNMFQISKYIYFRENNDHVVQSKSYAEEKRDESRNNGSLANVLKVLKEVHQRFFSGGDISEILKKDVRDLLQDCLPICETFSNLNQILSLKTKTIS